MYFQIEFVSLLHEVTALESGVGVAIRVLTDIQGPKEERKTGRKKEKTKKDREKTVQAQHMIETSKLVCVVMFMWI